MSFLTDSKYEAKAFNTIRSPVLRKKYGEFQLEFLMENGLTGSSHILELGCGDLRLGEQLIPIVSSGKYFGADINQNNLDRGIHHLKSLGIDLSRSHFIRTLNTKLDSIDNDSIDIAFSNSVFSHMTLNTIILCLITIMSKLKPGTSYYSSMILIDEAADLVDEHTWEQDGKYPRSFPARDPYHYKFSMIAANAALAGMACELMPKYGHPFQKMVRFARPA